MLILNEFFRLLIMEFSYLASNGYTYSRENAKIYAATMPIIRKISAPL